MKPLIFSVILLQATSLGCAGSLPRSSGSLARSSGSLARSSEGLAAWVDRDTACIVVGGNLYWLIFRRASDTMATLKPAGTSPCAEIQEADLMTRGGRAYLLCRDGAVYGLSYGATPELVRSPDDVLGQPVRLAELDGGPIVVGVVNIDGRFDYYYERMSDGDISRVGGADGLYAAVNQRDAERGLNVWIDRGKEVGSGWVAFDYHWSMGGMRCYVESEPGHGLSFAPSGFAVYKFGSAYDTRILVLAGTDDGLGFAVVYSDYPERDYYVIGEIYGSPPKFHLTCTSLEGPRGVSP